MSKFRILARICASTASTASTFSRYTVEALFPQSRGTVEALFSPIVRRISRLKTAIYSASSRGCRGSFPNYSQEIDILRESVDFSPSEPRFPDSWEFGDDFDEDDYDDWWEGEGCEDFDGEYGDCEEEIDPVEEVVSWTRRAVDEIIEEEEGDNLDPYWKRGDWKPGDFGDIPF